MCFDYGFDGFVLRKTRRFGKQIIACKFSKKWQKLLEEIQQQMQDNIQWIKGGKIN
jgi:hypothetical protein